MNNDMTDIVNLIQEEKQRGFPICLTHLSFDPGIQNISYAITQQTISDSYHSHLECIEYGFLEISEHATLLESIYRSTEILTEEYKPDSISCESVFFGNNITSAIGTSKTIAIIELVASQQNLIYRDINPATLKKFLTGNGRATKEEMLTQVISLYIDTDILENTVYRCPTKVFEYTKEKAHHIIDAMAVGIWMARHFQQVL